MKYSRLSITSIATGIISMVAGIQLILCCFFWSGTYGHIMDIVGLQLLKKWEHKSGYFLLIWVLSCSITAIITGVLGVKRTTAEERKGKDMAKAGLILGILSFIFAIVVVFGRN